ncbi:ABC transporter ATP-binding protein [Paenarthrobacter histidinolovorans]|uniref:ABC transport system ATP-binding protein n=1 Tax=Paenarthrobacter histidinolovorans TaxID=43664 RepID=A0ABW8MZM1_9MICC
MSVLKLEDIHYRYFGAKKYALSGISTTFHTGSINVILGRSGSGKTTLLSLLSGLDTATSGRILYQDTDLATSDRDAYRAQEIGVVFQSYNLLTTASAVENVVLSMRISGRKESKMTGRAYELLGAVGIDRETADRRVLQLSGGEQQRVGIARALSHDPSIVIADEPTGNLDKDTQRAIMEIFTRLAHSDGKCVIIVTHSNSVASYADYTHMMDRGSLIAVRPKTDR